MKMLQLGGWVILVTLWFFISHFGIISPHTLPPPHKVVHAFFVMLKEDKLVTNILFSLKLNFVGYIESIVFALPVGFLLGLNRVCRNMFSQIIDSLRFVPITALGGIFIALFGLEIGSKIHFLAFGIWVYLIPVVVQRIDEVNRVHLQMMQTLGASRWQVLYHIYWKSVMSRLSDDIRILVGISWTYIVVAELKNVQGGLGSLIFLGEKQSNYGKVYCAIIIIIIIGVIQDKIFKQVDKKLFKHKYV